MSLHTNADIKAKLGTKLGKKLTKRLHSFLDLKSGVENQEQEIESMQTKEHELMDTIDGLKEEQINKKADLVVSLIDFEYSQQNMTKIQKDLKQVMHQLISDNYDGALVKKIQNISTNLDNVKERHNKLTQLLKFILSSKKQTVQTKSDDANKTH